MFSVMFALVVLAAGVSAAPLNETLVGEEIVFQPLNSSEPLAKQARMIIIYAGPVGTAANSGSFSDCASNYQGRGPVTMVNMWTGSLVDRIQLKYGNYYGPINGGSGGYQKSMQLYYNEHITYAFGRTRNGYLTAVGFRTNMGRTFGSFGSQVTSDPTWYSSAPSGKRLVCIAGRYFVSGSSFYVGSLTLGWGA